MEFLNSVIENGRLWVLGEGAEGVKWYNVASAQEMCQMPDGSEGTMTIQQAYDAGELEVAAGHASLAICQAITPSAEAA